MRKREREKFRTPLATSATATTKTKGEGLKRVHFAKANENPEKKRRSFVQL